MKGTYILNILALLFFENMQIIYYNSRLNGTQSKDVKWGVGVEGASFHGFVNDESLWNLFWCFLCIFYYRNSPIFKALGQFENLGFVIMSTRENIRLIARAPLLLYGDPLLSNEINQSIFHHVHKYILAVLSSLLRITSGTISCDDRRKLNIKHVLRCP